MDRNLRRIEALNQQFMSTAEVAQIVACSHCGEHCYDDSISSGESTFCCTGCKTVYELLHDNGMQAYYAQGDVLAPGISQKNGVRSDYSYLDQVEISSKVMDFSDGKTAWVTFRTPQIHCASCVWLLENLPRLNPGVLQSQVFFDRREVTVRFNQEELKLSQLASLLSRIGYRPDLQLDKVTQKKSNPVDRSRYLKIGVAGFAFGNIMLFSLPEYLSGPDGVDDQFRTLFGALNIVLALPVFFYSSLDFFKPAWLSIRQRFWSMDIAISLGIIAMFFRSLYEISTGISGGYMDSFTMLVFLLLVGRLFQRKTFDQLSFERDYASYFPLSVTRMTNIDSEESVAATTIEQGDVVVIRHGELLPADSILMDTSASLDYSFVTGEADPVYFEEGQTCFAGGRNLGTSLRFQVLRPVSTSYLTRLWNHEVFNKDHTQTLQSVSQRFSRYFSPVVLVLAILSGLYWLPESGSLAINAFTAVLIVACPCALALSAPFSLGWATNVLARNNVYVKNGEVIERLAQSDAIVFDKTGTLTRRDLGNVVYMGRGLSEQEKKLLISVLKENTHPHGRSFFKWLLSNSSYTEYLDLKNYEEIVGEGVQAIVGDVLVRIGSANWIGIHNAFSIETDHPRLYFSFDDDIPGYVQLQSEFRTGVQDMISKLKSHFLLYVLSGDNSRDKVRIQRVFGDTAELHFSQSPQEKLKVIESIQLNGHRPIMVGDGLNDAGALKAGYVGISVTEDTSSFTPASDVIMSADKVGDLDKIIEYSKSTVGIIYISFAISLMYNVVGLAFAVTATLSPIVCAIIMPVSSITVIAYTTIATHWSAKMKGVRT
jgi:P-type Cu+ transporter